MTERNVIVSWGELLWDLFPDGPQLGGCAANVAHHLARLGDNAVLVSRIGDDEPGRTAIARLRGAGVDVRRVQVDSSAPTGSVTVRVTNGEPVFTIATQAAWDRIEWEESLGRCAAGAAVLCYGTLAQRSSLSSRALRELMRHTPAECIKVCDLNVRAPHASRQVVDEAIDLADAVKLNTAEARYVARLFCVDDVVRWLLDERSVRLVALTRGHAGAVISTGRGQHVHGGHPVRTSGGDTVGAGDAFTAVLAHHLARGSSIARMNEAANRYASEVAALRGAMPAVPDDVVASVR